VVGSSGNTALFGLVYGFNGLRNKTALAHFDFYEDPRVLAPPDQIDF
jgi:hypothetical protein